MSAPADMSIKCIKSESIIIIIIIIIIFIIFLIFLKILFLLLKTTLTIASLCMQLDNYTR